MVADDPALAGWAVQPIAQDLDLLDPRQSRAAVAAAAPDAVVHLAAQGSVAESFRNPAHTIETNVIGTLRLLEALEGASFRGRVVFVSSGDVYGRVPETAIPVAESFPPAPRSPYAVSKLAAEHLCTQWSQTAAMDVVIARPFNHIGPGQSEIYAVAGFARQVAEIRAGRRPPRIDVGDLDVTRDFTDVRDVVRAYFALLDRGVRGECYNVCSGEERTLRSMLEAMIAIAGIEADIRPDPSRMRPSEQRRAGGDPAKLKRTTGWSPTVPMARSLQDVLDEMEKRISR